MKRFSAYFKLQLKRYLRAYPWVIAVTLILVLGVAATLGVVIESNTSSESSEKIKIGVVGDYSDSYFKTGITALENLDTSRLSIDLVRCNSEDDAKVKLSNDTISAYVLVPEGFVESVLNGENKSLKYVMNESSSSIGAVLSAEAVKTVTNMITKTQTGITAAAQYCYDTNNTENMSDKNKEMNIMYINLVFSRSNTAQVENIGLKDGLNSASYYFCGIATLFLLLFGIAFCPLLAKKNLSFNWLLSSKGAGVTGIVLGEFLSFVLFSVATVLIVAFIVGVCGSFVNFEDIGIVNINIQSMLVLWLNVIPAVAAVCAVQYFLYEITSGIISGVLVQFVAAAGLGYISGCFYPDYFFPQAIRTVAFYLPSGAAFSSVRSALALGTPSIGTALCVAYAVVFVILALLIRRRKLSHI